MPDHHLCGHSNAAFRGGVSTLIAITLMTVYLSINAGTHRAYLESQAYYHPPLGHFRPLSQAMTRLIRNQQNYVKEFRTPADEDIERYAKWCHSPDNPACISFGVRNGKVYVNALKFNFQTRHISMLLLVNRLAVKTKLPDVDFVINIGDGQLEKDGYGGMPVMAFGQQTNNHVALAVPDFTFWSWPESVVENETESHSFSNLLDVYQTKICRSFDCWKRRRNDIFWRGASLGKRPDYVRNVLSQPLKSPKLNVEFMEWKRNGPDGKSVTENAATLVDHCSHRYLLHFDGMAYSSRFKYLLLCGSPVIMGTQTWEEWFYGAFDETSYIPVKSDYSDVMNKLNSLSLDTSYSIGQRGQALAFDLFDEDAVDQYFYAMIKAVADLGYVSKRKPIGRLLEDVLLNTMGSFVC